MHLKQQNNHQCSSKGTIGVAEDEDVGVAEDEDVVQVGKGVIVARQDAVHQALEVVASVPHSEGHAGELKQAKWRGDGHLG